MDVGKLKEPSADPPVLQAAMRATLGRLAVISGVRAANVGVDVGKGKPEASPPPKVADKNLLYRLREEYEECGTNWDRLKVIKKAQRHLNRMSTGVTLERRRGTPEWKRAIANDARASAIVGRDFGVSASYVRKLRMELR